MEAELKETMTQAAHRFYQDAVVGDIFNGFGVEVTLPDPDAFLKVKETLTRVGIQSIPGRLDQPCFILHKRGRYAIMHWAELRQMDGEMVEFDAIEQATAVRNTVASLLDQWGLVSIVNGGCVAAPRCPIGRLKIVPHKAKSTWQLNPLYEIGKRR